MHHAHSSTIYSRQDTAKTQMSTERGVDKDVTHTLCNGILLCHRKELNCAVFRNMTITLNAVSQKETHTI